MEEDSKTNSENSNEVQSPLLFSSDEDEDSCSKGYEYPFEQPTEPEATQSLAEKESPTVQALTRETARLNRLQALLQGVPPPPLFTIPQIDCNELVTLWRKNKDQFDEAIKKGKEIVPPVQNCMYSSSHTEEEVRKLQWPEIRNVQFYDIYYNISHSSEELDRLSQKLRERFVGAETSTWCNAVASDIPSSAKKRQRMRGWGQGSPGGRLSHLARRRQMFSSAGLQQLMNNSNKDAKPGPSGTAMASRSMPFRRSAAGMSERRCIMLDAKKTNTRKSTRGSSAKKRGASAAKEPAMPKLVPAAHVKPAVQATKRALFQSPEEQRRPVIQRPAANESPKNRALRSKRALWPSTSNPEAPLNENGKRALDSDSTSSSQASKVARGEAPYVRSSRSLPSSVGAKSSQAEKKTDLAESSDLRRLSYHGGSSRVSEMSELHKRKLVWAVSQALRTEGISSKHPDFRPCLTALALHYDQVRREWTGPPPASTSEHMLQVVSARVADVVRSHRINRAGASAGAGAGAAQADGNADTQSRQSGVVKELFRDATSSLNVRPSLDTSLTNHSRASLDAKMSASRRIPSARKSLTFENFEDLSSKSNKSFDAAQSRTVSGESKVVERKADAKRVSRTLFETGNDCKQTPKSESHDVKKSSAEESSSSDKIESEGSLLKINSDTKVVTVSEKSSSSSTELPGKSSSAECASPESLEESAKPARRRLKRHMSPCDRRVTRRAWVSGQKDPSGRQESELQEKSASSAELSFSTVSSFLPPAADSTSDVADKDLAASSTAQESEVEDSKPMESTAPSPPSFLHHSPQLSEGVDPGEGSSKERILNGGPITASASEDAHGDASTSLTAGSPKNRGSDHHENLESDGNLESNVITPILEANATDLSLASKSKEGSVANGDLSFSGRIEGLKPAEEEKENNVDLGIVSASACLLDLKDEEKGPDLTRWAEMATRSMKKDTAKANQANDYVKHFGENLLQNGSQQQFATSASADESSYPWIVQPQLNGNDSQCPSKLYEQYKSIFDSSSQGGNS